VIAAALVLLSSEALTWFIHDKTQLWSLRIFQMVFELCLAAALIFIILKRQQHLRSKLMGEMKQRKAAEKMLVVEAMAREGVEGELRRSEERMRVAMEAARIGLWNWDVIHDEHTWSERGKALLGLASDSPANFHVLMNSIHPEDRDKMRAEINSAIQEKRDYSLQFRALWPDGSIHWQAAKGRVFYDDGGRTTRMTGITMDINERKLAEERLRLQAAALEATANAIVITDCQGMILWTNPAFTELTGYAAEEAFGHSPRFLSSGKHDHAFYKKLWQEITTGNTWQGEIVNRRKDGTLYTEEMTITPVHASGGEITHFVAIKQDVTKRKLLEDQFRQSQKMEAVGRLAGGVAHDFNNALAVITSYAELLQMKMPPDEPLRKHVQQVLKASDRAASLTRQLLAFSRKQTIEPSVLDLNSIVTEVDKMLRRLIGEDIELSFKNGSDLKCVKADRGQVEQILMNLAVNARDAMPDGGKLVIETANVELDEIYVRQHPFAKTGRYVMLSVSDTGCGMNKEVQAHIFDPFFTTKEVGKGTGLGLSTVYGIVKQSDGHISVYSEVGKGATFRIYFPEVQAVVDSPATESVVNPLPSGTETILLVEDEDSLREVTRDFLQNGGYEVLEADSGESALELTKQYQGRLDLLLTDVIMPGISGRQLADQLVPSRPEMKILFMSGYTQELVGHHGVLNPETVLLEKPFGVESLLTKIREVLDAQPMNSDSAQALLTTSPI
jgi:two-component system cell cycle sensor histidine kinase/response regulator CckA